MNVYRIFIAISFFFLASSARTLRQHDYSDTNSDCARVLDSLFYVYEAECNKFVGILQQGLVPNRTRLDDVKQEISSTFLGINCLTLKIVHHQLFEQLLEEAIFMEELCEIPDTPNSAFVRYFANFTQFIQSSSDSVTRMFNYVCLRVSHKFSEIGLYDSFVFVVSAVFPYFAVSYWVLHNHSMAILTPLASILGIDFRWLWFANFFVGLHIIVPFVLTFILMIFVAVRYVNNRKLLREYQIQFALDHPDQPVPLALPKKESLRSFSYTFLFIFSLGCFFEFMSYVNFRYVWLNVFGVLAFIVTALVTFWGRQYSTVEYKVVTWRNGVAVSMSKPSQITVETVFPYTLFNTINKFRLWTIGIDWNKVASKLVYSPSGTSLVPGAAVASDPAVIPLTDAGTPAVMTGPTNATVIGQDVTLPFPVGPMPAAVAPPLDYSKMATKGRKNVNFAPALAKSAAQKAADASRAKAISDAEQNRHPQAVDAPETSIFDNDFVTYEGKGKNKKGRGAMHHNLRNNNTHKSFVKTNRVFWMSDPDIESSIDYVKEWTGSAWRFVERDDWGAIDGYIQLIKSDGSKQYVFYDEDYEEDQHAEIVDDFFSRVTRESYDLAPNQPVPNLFVVKCRETVFTPEEVLAARLHELEVENSAIREHFVDCQKRNERMFADILSALTKSKESNGSVNALPVQPKPDFESPVLALMPHGCYHHMSCPKKLSSTPKSCSVVCSGPSCVHGDQCTLVVTESFEQPLPSTPKAVAAPTAEAKAKPLPPTPKAKKPAPKPVRSLDSAVASNPLVEFSEDLLASVVVILGNEGRGYGIYTDRGVLTQSHVIGTGDFTVAPFYAPAMKTNCKQINVNRYNGHAEIVLVNADVSNCTGIALQSFMTLNKRNNGAAASHGAIVCPSGSVSGSISYKPGVADELLIVGGTKAGMCGCPYVVGQKIVGFHLFGNNNGVNNGGLAVTEPIMKWLGTFKKN